jgi:hypothetical protein
VVLLPQIRDRHRLSLLLADSHHNRHNHLRLKNRYQNHKHQFVKHGDAEGLMGTK